MTTSRLATGLLAAAVLASGALTGCGDDDDTTAVAVDRSSTTETTSVVETVLGRPNPATGAPVRIGFVTAEGGAALDLPETRQAAQAVATYANEYLGGLAGNPIELVTCEDKSDGASGTACANRFAEADVAAVVVGQVANADLYVPILSGAGIPWIVATGTGPQELMSDHAFALGGGLVGIVAASAQYAEGEGFDRVAVFAIDVPAFTGLFSAIGLPAFDRAGVAVDLVTVPPGTPDATPQVASAMNLGPDAVIVFAEESLCKALLPAIHAANVRSVPVLMPGLCASDDVVSSVGADAVEGAILNGNTVSLGEGPEAELYAAVMTEYGNADLVAGHGAAGYVSMLGLVRAVNAMVTDADVTSEVILGALRSAMDVPMPGIDSVTFTCDGSALAFLPALCSTGTLFARYQGGTLSDFTVVDGSPLLQG